MYTQLECVRFLQRLRGLLRSSLANAFISIPSELNASIKQRILHSCDTALKIESFTGEYHSCETRSADGW